ncbi:acetyl-CoA acetyltransferase [Staphylococcus aureus]|uniref:Acetyl-CoA acetyltransferase n=1 Tax=Staphylococcus aureus TaxID=1280 RepID=A0A380DKH1_STAAU|nr:acetyl-CoA acetyltransferase [Staphylococcus aureus]
MYYTASGKIAREKMISMYLRGDYNMNQAVIVAAKRTAFGKYGGTLKHLEPEQLLKPLSNILKRSIQR